MVKEIHLLMGYPYSGKDDFLQGTTEPIIDIEGIKKSFRNIKNKENNHEAYIYKMVLYQMKLPEYKGKKIFIKDYLLDKKTRNWFIKIAKNYDVPIYLYFFQCQIPYICEQIEKEKDLEARELLRKLHSNFDLPLKDEGFDDVIFVNDEEMLSI